MSDRFVVVDADVAGRAGEPPRTDDAQAARAVLRAAEGPEVRLRMDPQLLDEWRRNGSRFATQWLTLRFQRGRVDRRHADTGPIAAFLDRTLAPDGVEARRKDAHLLALAMDSGAVIASGDVHSRNGFHGLCRHRPPYARVAWCAVPGELAAFEAWCADGRQPPTICTR